jgi:hypothetical protein
MWARDNILWAVVVLVVPPAAVYFHDPSHSIDWPLIRTTLWLYVAAFVIYAIYQSAHAAVTLDAERYVRILEAERRASDAEALNTRPKIVPEILECFWDIDAPSRDTFSFVYASIRLTNHNDVATHITKYELNIEISNVKFISDSETTYSAKRKAEDSFDFDDGTPLIMKWYLSRMQIAPLIKGVHQDVWLKFPVDLESVYTGKEAYPASVMVTVTDSFGVQYPSQTRWAEVRMDTFVVLRNV